MNKKNLNFGGDVRLNYSPKTKIYGDLDDILGEENFDKLSMKKKNQILAGDFKQYSVSKRDALKRILV